MVQEPNDQVAKLERLAELEGYESVKALLAAAQFDCVIPGICTSAELNDALRHTGEGGRIVMTSGVAAFGPDFIIAVMAAVRTFSAFTEDNDPYGEHDFGLVEVEEQTVYWKIDYYDQSLEGLSPDPANPELTVRVLTVMLASEY